MDDFHRALAPNVCIGGIKCSCNNRYGKKPIRHRLQRRRLKAPQRCSRDIQEVPLPFWFDEETEYQEAIDEFRLLLEDVLFDVDNF